MKYQEGMVIQGKSGKLYIVKSSSRRKCCLSCLKCVFSCIVNDVCYCAARTPLKEFGKTCDKLIKKDKYFRPFEEEGGGL